MPSALRVRQTCKSLMSETVRSDAEMRRIPPARVAVPAGSGPADGVERRPADALAWRLACLRVLAPLGAIGDGLYLPLLCLRSKRITPSSWRKSFTCPEPASFGDSPSLYMVYSVPWLLLCARSCRKVDAKDRSMEGSKGACA